MTVDPPRARDMPTHAVFDVDGVGLIQILRRMNEGFDATGTSIGEPTFFCVGAALNPAADDVEREIDRMHRKIEAGARWLQTQPVYDLEQLERFLARAGGSPVPVLSDSSAAQLPHADFSTTRSRYYQPRRIRARMRHRSSRRSRGDRDGAHLVN